MQRDFLDVFPFTPISWALHLTGQGRADTVFLSILSPKNINVFPANVADQANRGTELIRLSIRKASPVNSA